MAYQGDNYAQQGAIGLNGGIGGGGTGGAQGALPPPQQAPYGGATGGAAVPQAPAAGPPTPYGGAGGAPGGSNFGGAVPGATGLQSGSGGNFLEGVGNFFGFGSPTTIGNVGTPTVGRDDYYLGGSQAAAGQLLSDAKDSALRAQQRGGPQLNTANFDRGLQSSFGLQGAEQAYTQRLTAAANGQGPSVAAATYRQAADDATKRAQGQAVAARGGMGLLGARQAAETAFAGGQQAATGAGMIREREMQAAQDALGRNLQDRNNANLSRGALGLQGAQAGANLELAGRGQNDALYNAEMGRYGQMLGANQSGLQAYNQQMSNNTLGAAGLNVDIAKTNLQQQNAQDAKRGSVFGSVFKGLGGGLPF